MEILASRMLLRQADYQRSLSFYRDEIGLAIAREYGAGTVFFAGQSLLELAGYGSPDHSRGPFPGALWLQVRDIAATQAELTGRGVPIAREARREPWGLREMHVTDPDGITLIFVEVPGITRYAATPAANAGQRLVNGELISSNKSRYTCVSAISAFDNLSPLLRESGPVNIDLFLLIIVVITALAFDFTNGFHDTGNAMATSIATGALSPRVAVAVSGLLNFIGAFLSLAVAATIASGLVNTADVTLTVVAAGLAGGIIWNLITWLFGIPSSSSHALIGGVIGATIAAAGGSAVLWHGLTSKVIIPAALSPVIAG